MGNERPHDAIDRLDGLRRARVKGIKRVIGLAAGLGITGALVWALVNCVSFGGPEYLVFFNAKTAQALFQITVAMLTMLVFEWSQPGNTIHVIMDIHHDSHPDDKRTAAHFLLGIGLIAVLAVKGGAF